MTVRPSRCFERVPPVDGGSRRSQEPLTVRTVLDRAALVVVAALVISAAFVLLAPSGSSWAAALVLSRVFVSFGGGASGYVVLESSDAVTKAEQDPWCGASEGAVSREGRFALSFDGARLDLGRLWFASGTPHDGTLVVRKLDPGSARDVVILLQYGSCAGETAIFFGYDVSRRRLVRLGFRYRDGHEDDSIFVTPFDLPAPFIDIDAARTFVSRSYSNVTGSTTAVRWTFREADGVFDEVTSWTEPCCGR